MRAPKKAAPSTTDETAVEQGAEAGSSDEQQQDTGDAGNDTPGDGGEGAGDDTDGQAQSTDNGDNDKAGSSQDDQEPDIKPGFYGAKPKVAKELKVESGQKLPQRDLGGRYRCAARVSHGGTKHRPGTVLVLTDEEARSYLKDGPVIEPLD